MSSLVKVTLHGEIGKRVGANWDLKVSSVSEAINAIQQLSDGKLYRYLGAKEKKGIKYRVLINGEDFISEKSLDDESQVEEIKNTNLVVKIDSLKTIDVIPVIEGAGGGFLTTILGALLVIVGAVLLFTGAGTALGVGLIMIGAGLLAAGITALLAKPPVFDDFRSIGGGAKVSYLFNGPENVTKEGGPVPIGYGRLLVGSQVIGASYVNKDSLEEKKDYTNNASKFYVWSTRYDLKSGDPFYNIPLIDDYKAFMYDSDSNNQNGDGLVSSIAGGYYELNTDGSLKIYRPLPDNIIWYLQHFKNPIDALSPWFYGPEPDENPFPDAIFPQQYVGGGVGYGAQYEGKSYPYRSWNGIPYTNTAVTEPVDEGIKTATQSGVVSVSEIEVLDLISEGPIEGLVESEITFTGTEGSVGWDSYTETKFDSAPGTLGYKWLRSVYFNQVPIVDSNNKYNFQRVDIAQTKGDANGSLLIGSSLYQLNISRTISERLRGSKIDDAGNVISDFAKIYRIYNRDCSGAIVNVKIPRISKTDVETGDITSTFVDYKIYYRPFYSNANKNYSGLKAEQKGFFGPVSERIEGKLQSSYIRSTTIKFPEGPLAEPDFAGWEIKIYRTTDDSISVYLSNQTYVDSITEIYSNIFSYPYSAIIRSRYNAEFFASVPQRAYDTKLLKVKVPKNYDPIKKSYATSGAGTTNGVWNGEFADNLAWTDNPAWCFYDILTNKRYGLGEYIDESQVDKFSLYQIARYCDTLVPDGYGGLEPRFTCNLIMYTREEAYKVLNDLASIFNAMVYYSNGSISVVQDRPKDPITFFTNANVEDGNFNYSGTSKRTRNTIAVVRYNDPKNYFKPAIEYVQNIDGIRKYGTRTTEVAAFGCTSKGQATRLGNWMLFSELNEIETVSFVAGLEAAYLRPGDIFGVYDAHRKTYKNSGRLISIVNSPTSAVVTIDGDLTLDSGVVYYFNLVTPSFNYDASQVSDINAGDEDEIRKSFIQKIEFTSADVSIVDNQTVISLSSGFNDADYIVEANQVWVVEQKESANPVDTNEEFNKSIDKSYDYYRVVRITEKDNGRYEVGGVQYVDSKFDDITQSVSFERDDVVINNVPQSPQDLQLSSSSQNKKTLINYVITPPNISTSLTSYKIYISKTPFSSSVPDNTYLNQTIPSVSNPAGIFYPDSMGTYYFRVYSFNDEARVYSTSYIDRNIFVSEVEAIRSVVISSLALNKAQATSSFSSTVDSFKMGDVDAGFTWQVGLTDNNAIAPDSIRYRITIREPQVTASIPSNNIYYEVTGISNPSFKFDFSTNSALPGGPYRNYEVVAEAYDGNFKTSAGNLIGHTGSSSEIIPRAENGWNFNSNGYDRIYVYSDVISGINLSIPTGGFGRIVDSGKFYQYIDFNGGVNVLFPENYLSTGIIGGIMYASTGYFTSGNIISGRQDIVVRKFSYDQYERFAHAPAVFNPYLPFNTGWLCISVYDSFDREYLAKNPNYFTGIAFSNTVPIFATGFVNSLEVKDDIRFVNNNNRSDQLKLSINNVADTGTYRLSVQEGSHGEVILMSRKP